MWRRVWIWKRTLKKDQTYCLRWHDETGRIRTETVGPDKRLAERLRTRREEDLNSGRLRGIRKIAYETFQNEELEAMNGRLAESSLESLERTLAGFGEVCKVKWLADVTPAMVEGFFSERLRCGSLATANKYLRTLKASLNRAVRRGYLERNPASDVKQVREPEKELRVLTPQEVGRLLSACQSVRWKVLVALAVTTGMRLNEMLSLRWEDVDVETGTVWVRNRPGHLTKSRRNRILALVPAICTMLGRVRHDGQFVLHTQAGRLWRNNVQRGFGAIVKRAGIPRCTLHDLRRTFISHLAMAGVNEAVVKELAGHAAISTTLRYYTRIMPQALRSAQARLPFDGILRDISDTYHGPSDAEDEETVRVIIPAFTGT